MAQTRSKTFELEEIPGRNKTEKFRFMHNFGYDEKEVMTKLKISKKRFLDYLKVLEESTTAYLNYLAKTGHIATMVTTLQQQAKDIQVQEELRDIAMYALRESPRSHKLMYVLNHTNISLHKMRAETFELQGKTPLAAAFRQFVKKNIVEKKRDIGDNSNNKYHMPVLPDELTN